LDLLSAGFFDNSIEIIVLFAAKTIAMSTSSAEEKRKISFKIESASKRRKDFLRSKWTDPDSALASAPPDPYYPLYSPQTQEQQAEDDAFDDQTTNDDEMVEHDLSAQRNLEDVIAKAIKLDAEAAKKDGTGLWDVVRKVKYSVPTGSWFHVLRCTFETSISNL
jgi:hypothetical protein